MEGQRSNRRAFGALIFARLIYAINWVNFGAIFYLMEQDLGGGVSGLGNVTAAFYLGLGLLQIPGGLLAARWGPKRVVVAGIFISSFSVLGTSAAPNLAVAEALRFLVGWGMAFVFAPAVIIISSLIRGGRSGLGVGVLNSTFDLGGLVGLFGWVVLASVTGWRPSLELSGALGVLTGALAAVFLPGEAKGPGFRVDRKSLVTVLRDRQLVLLGLGTLGFGVSYTDVSGFMTLYGVKSLAVSGITAGLATSLVTVVPIFTALWGGRMFDMFSSHKWVMAATLAGSGAAMGLVSYHSLYAAAIGSAVVGIVNGIGYTFAFAGARDLNRAGKQYESLAVAWVNSISLTGSFFPPVLFSFVAQRFGYGAAWLSAGVLTLLFIAPVALMVERWRR